MSYCGKISPRVTCEHIIVGNEFEPVEIASFSAPPELPEVMKSAEGSTADLPKTE